MTPIITGVVGVIIVRIGHRMATNQQLHNELMKKRLAVFEEIAPKINDIYCFYQAVGHWTELSPDDVIRRKRAIDRAIQVNRYLFRSEFWDAYKAFETSHFEMFSGPGQPARLRVDIAHMTPRAGALFKDEWKSAVSIKGGDNAEQRRSYNALMEILGREVIGAL